MGLLLGFLVGVMPVSAGARENEEPHDLTLIPIEELANLKVYSASKFLQKTSDAPSSITIISSDEIERYGYRTFADVLRSVPGFYINYDRNYSYIGMRGFGKSGDYNTRLLVLIDGHRINENVFDGAYLGTEFPLNLGLIERVEVVKGPGSSLYGTNAFFAVVNVITKRGRDLESGLFKADAGSFSMYRGRVTVGQKLNSGFEYLLSGSYFDSKGQRQLYYPEFDDPKTNNGIAQDVDEDRGGNLFANGAYKDLSFAISYSSRTKAIPTASFGTYFNDRRTQTIDERGYVDIKFEHTFRLNWDLVARTYVDSYNYHGTYALDYSQTDTPNVVLNRDNAIGHWWGAEVQVSRFVFQKHRLTAGAEFRNNFRQDQANFDSPPNDITYLDSREHSFNAALFLQDEFTFHKKLILNAGLRYDHYCTFGSTINPRLGLIYHPQEGTTVKLLYGQAFRAPNAYELYYSGAGNKANPNLTPESIRTLELVLERLWGRNFRITLSPYLYRLSSLITEEVDPADQLILYMNTGKIRARGFESVIEVKGFHGVEGRITYALQRGIDLSSGKSLTNSPEHLASLNISFPIYQPSLHAGLELRFTSARKTINESRVGGSLLADVTLLNRKLARNIDLAASIYNLFNKRYADPGGEEHRQDSILQDGRTFKISVTYRFPFFGAGSFRDSGSGKP